MKLLYDLFSQLYETRAFSGLIPIGLSFRCQ